jgi:hypothetical protein
MLRTTQPTNTANSDLEFLSIALEDGKTKGNEPLTENLCALAAFARLGFRIKLWVLVRWLTALWSTGGLSGRYMVQGSPCPMLSHRLIQ